MIVPSVQHKEGWILFDGRVPESSLLPHRSSDDFEERLLARSADLPGGCKFALVPGSTDLHVRAELPDLPDVEVGVQVAAVEAGFAAAAEQLGIPAAPSHDSPDGSPHPPAQLASLCLEAGWPFEERADGTLAVDLGVQGTYLPACVRVCDPGVAVEAEIAELPAAPGARRAAFIRLLLRANGIFRMARAVLRPTGSEPGSALPIQAVLEAPLRASASAAELGEALASLTVAAQRCALEARLLASDEQLASVFLGRTQCGARASASPRVEVAQTA